MGKKKNFVKYSLGMIMTFLIFCSLNQAQAGINWSETFDSGTNLTFKAWSLSDTGYYVENDSAKPAIVNKTLQMPNTRNWGTWSSAQRNTTIAYGTWSFDYTIKEGDNHTSCDVIFFVSNMPWDLTGYSLHQVTLDVDAYYLAIKSGSSGETWKTSLDHNIDLGRTFDGIEAPLSNYQFPADITGTHHIEITRDQEGKLEVYFDSEKIINYTDNSITSSEICIFGSWSGDSAFDNIIVEEAENKPTPGFELAPIVTASLVLTITRFRRKKNI